MRHINGIFAVGSFLLLSGPCLVAAELPATYDLGRLNSTTDNSSLLEQSSTEEKIDEITGKISSYDDVLGRLSITNAQGQVMEFSVDSITPILDVNQLQIGFDNLRPGDRVTVHYNVEPLRVNQIDKI